VADDKVGNAVLSISLDEASAKRVFSALDDLKKKTGETAAAAKTISFVEISKGLLELGKIGFEALSKIVEGHHLARRARCRRRRRVNSFGVLAAPGRLYRPGNVGRSYVGAWWGPQRTSI
jgi:hypothetical protein